MTRKPLHFLVFGKILIPLPRVKVLQFTEVFVCVF